MLFKGQFLKNHTVNVKYWLVGRDSCVKKLSDLTHSDALPGVAYTGASSLNAKSKIILHRIPLTGLEVVH
jgi:hypothetical protein